jgi:hypothetical protein
MQKKLQDIATIRSGAYIKAGMSEDIGYLQVNDFDKAENRFVLPKPSLELYDKTK